MKILHVEYDVTGLTNAQRDDLVLAAVAQAEGCDQYVGVPVTTRTEDRPDPGPVSPMRKIVVSFDGPDEDPDATAEEYPGGTPILTGYTDGKTWNGFQCPWLPADELEDLLRWLADQGEIVSWDEVNERTYAIREHGMTYGYEAAEVETVDGRKLLFNCGNHGLAFVPEPDRCPKCGKHTHASDSTDDGVCSDCLTCHDCGRPMAYDDATGKFVHKTTPEIGCFLIPAVKPTGLTIGSKVLCNGYPGTVTAIAPETPQGMVNVRLERGTVCVSIQDVMMLVTDAE